MMSKLRVAVAALFFALPSTGFAQDGTILVIASHPVTDYAQWRTVYDGFADEQRAGGVLEEEVLRDFENPNMIYVLHRFTDAASANAYFSSPVLQAGMKDAGVAGPPTITMVRSAD